MTQTAAENGSNPYEETCAYDGVKRSHSDKRLGEMQHWSQKEHFSELPAEIFRLIASTGLIGCLLMTDSRFLYSAGLPVRACEHRSSGVEVIIDLDIEMRAR